MPVIESGDGEEDTDPEFVGSVPKLDIAPRLKKE
jgi:hypothetical protein